MGKFSIGKNEESKANTKTTEREFIQQAKTKDGNKGRSDYKRISFNLPPKLVSELRNYSLKLKDDGKEDSGVSSIVTIACISYLAENGIDIDESIIATKTKVNDL